MEHRKKTFSEQLSYIFFPKEGKGTTLFDRLILQSLGAEDAWVARKDNNPQEKQLIEMTVEMSRVMGLAHSPPLLIYQSDKPNAASLVSGKIVIGTNLLEILTPEQLKAVIGHELAHHRHLRRDWTVRLSAVALTIWSFMAIHKANKLPEATVQPIRTKHKILDWMTGKNIHTHRELSNKVLLEDAAILLGADLVGKAQQRALEYEADKESGTYTGKAGDMVDALLSLEKRIEEIKLEKLKRENPGIVFPTEIETDDKPKQDPSWIQRVGKGITHLFADHPPFDKRINRLEQIEEQQQQIPAASTVIR